jgi:hypothetical protein
VGDAQKIEKIMLRGAAISGVAIYGSASLYKSKCKQQIKAFYRYSIASGADRTVDASIKITESKFYGKLKRKKDADAAMHLPRFHEHPEREETSKNCI